MKASKKVFFDEKPYTYPVSQNLKRLRHLSQFLSLAKHFQDLVKISKKSKNSFNHSRKKFDLDRASVGLEPKRRQEQCNDDFCVWHAQREKIDRKFHSWIFFAFQTVRNLITFRKRTKIAHQVLFPQIGGCSTLISDY